MASFSLKHSKVRIHDERDAQLAVLVCEEEGGVVPAWHLHPLGPVRLAVRDVIMYATSRERKHPKDLLLLVCRESSPVS